MKSSTNQKLSMNRIISNPRLSKVEKHNESIKQQRYKTGSFTTDDLNYGVPVVLSILITLIVVAVFKL